MDSKKNKINRILSSSGLKTRLQHSFGGKVQITMKPGEYDAVMKIIKQVERES